MEPIRRTDAALDTALILLVAIVSRYLPALLAPIDVDAAAVDPTTLIVSKWSEALLVTGLAGYLVLRHRIKWAAFGLHRRDPARQLAWAAMTFMASYAAIAITAVVFFALINPANAESEMAQRLEFFDENLPLSSFGSIVVLLTAVAVHEELLFRGLLLPYLRRVTGHWWPGVLIVSLIFGSLHFPQGWMAVAQISLLSVVLSVMFIASRSLLAVMAAHFLFDLCQLQIIRLLPDMLKSAA